MDNMKPNGISTLAIFTIASNNYLHFARTMLQSAKRNHPSADLYCVVVDSDMQLASALEAEFIPVSMQSLNIPLEKSFLFQYSILELNTAVKPWAIKSMLDRGYEFVVYVDPDTYFYGAMLDVIVALQSGSDILLTPHLLAPVADDKTPSELDIRRAGAYNMGFCAVRESRNVHTFLHWWQAKLMHDCVVDLESGIFVDQGWIDLVPGLFENVEILRHPGYNCAYWNLAQRPISKDSDGLYCCAGGPLIFFHFSGIDPVKPQIFSKHENRFMSSNLGMVASLVSDYVVELMRNGASKYARVSYGFGCFSSGETIPNEIRSLYRTSEEFRLEMGPNPFGRPEAMNATCLVHRINDEAPTYAMVALWRVRPDLQIIFPMNSVESVRDYYCWFADDREFCGSLPGVVAVHHRKMAKQWQALCSRSENSATSASWHSIGTRRVLSLYRCLLNRNADPAGLSSYGEMCNTTAGYFRAFRYIALSAESRGKPGLLMRALKALIPFM